MDEASPVTGLRRAQALIENYLWNEDGEDEGWLIEARDIVKATVETRVERLAEALGWAGAFDADGIAAPVPYLRLRAAAIIDRLEVPSDAR